MEAVQTVVLVMDVGAGHGECGPVLDDWKRAVPVLEEEPVAKVWDCSGRSEDKVQKLSHLSMKGLRERGKQISEDSHREESMCEGGRPLPCIVSVTKAEVGKTSRRFRNKEELGRKGEGWKCAGEQG